MRLSACYNGRMVTAHIDIDQNKIAGFCRKWKIKRLELFGSVLRDDFRPDSDIDVLYEFEADGTPGLEFIHAIEELSNLLGRKVDFVSREAVEKSHNHIRRESILERTLPIYVA